ncbi:MAG: DMT family transporter [Flavitalea sp.]
MPKLSSGYIATIAAATIWGVNSTMVQWLIANRRINIEWLVTVRLMIPGLILLLVYSFSKNTDAVFSIWNNKKDAIAIIIFGICFIGVQYTFFAAIKESNAATATIIQFSAPVMIAIYNALVGKKMPGAKELIAMILAMGGIFLLATKGDISTLSLTPVALAWGLSSAFTLAFYSIQPVRLLHKYKANLVVGWGMLIGGALLGLVHAPWNIDGDWDAVTYSFVGFIILFGGLVAFSLFLRALKLIGGYRATLLTSVEPLITTIIAITLLNVSFGPVEMVGGVMILSTIFLLSE